MAVFVTLYKFTDKGLRDIRESPRRLREGIEAFEKRGGRVLGAYYTIGEYDLVTIGEIADEQAGMAHTLEQNSLGNVRAVTLRGYTTEEFTGILTEMS